MDAGLVSAEVLRRIVSDPARNIPVFFSALKDVPRQGQRAIILGECLFAIAVPVPFSFVGGLSLRGIKIFIAGL